MACLTAVTLVLAAGAGTVALDRARDPRTLDEAIWIGQSRFERDRARFHAPYRLTAGPPPLDALEVVTPFRRIVLAAERGARMGERLFGHRQALEVLHREGETVDLILELTFHPHHTRVAVPAYDVVLLVGAAEMAPVEVDRSPRFGPRIDGPWVPVVPSTPDRPAPFTGARLTARFEAGAAIERAAVALLREGNEVLARVPLDFSTLR